MSDALRQEIDRVKRLKRKLEDEIEMLRLDSEEGKLHIRVNPDKEYRAKVAEAMVKECSPGEGHGCYVTNPVRGVVYHRTADDLYPWDDSNDYAVIVPVADLFDEAHDFYFESDWSIADVPYVAMARTYLQSQGEEMESDGSVPPHLTQQVVIDFAYESGNKKWVEFIDDHNALALEINIEFTLGQIKNEIIIMI